MTYRCRHVETKLGRIAEHFPIVLVTGARQVGKSTLLARMFPSVRCVTFDPLTDIEGARADADLFLDNNPPPLILDEVQFAPELFPALKRRVDKNRGAAQYFLSGSQQMGLLKNVSESLAGRVGIVELYPMTRAEIDGKGDIEPFISAYMQNEQNEQKPPIVSAAPEATLFRTVWRGGMPGTLEFPDELFADYFRSYVATYVERDIRRQSDIKGDIMDFGKFVGLSGALTAQEVNYSKWAREIDISPQTARSWLSSLCACFQWREVNAFEGNVVKRVAEKRKGYVVDSGLACHLQMISSAAALGYAPRLGALFETYIANTLISQLSAMAFPVRIWHWRTVNGAEVDLILERDGKLFPIEIKCKSNVTGHDMRGITAFQDTYKGAQRGLLIYAGNTVFAVGKNALAIPWWKI